MLGTPLTPPLHTSVAAFDHTASMVESCNQAFYSPDCNPFQLCPGPYPGERNYVWWAWEQWHLLGYNLPLNWGNATHVRVVPLIGRSGRAGTKVKPRQ